MHAMINNFVAWKHVNVVAAVWSRAQLCCTPYHFCIWNYIIVLFFRLEINILMPILTVFYSYIVRRGQLHNSQPVSRWGEEEEPRDIFGSALPKWSADPLWCTCYTMVSPPPACCCISPNVARGARPCRATYGPRVQHHLPDKNRYQKVHGPV